MLCAKCGMNLPEGAAFCASCEAPANPQQTGGTVSGPGIDEIGLFVGKNSGYYQTIFHKFNIHGVETFAPTWNWAAFLCTFFWMLYRKLYLWALLWFLLTLLPVFGFVFMIAAGISGNYLYYKHVIAKIRDAKSVPPPDRMPAILTELGGVNGWVIPVAVVMMVGFLLLALLFGIGVGLFYVVARKGMWI